MDWNLSNFYLPAGMAVITAVFCGLYVFVWGHRALGDEANERSLHQGQVLTSGGLFVVLPCCLYALFHSPDYWSLYGVVIMAAIGLADDLWHWPAKPKLLAQCGVTLLLLWSLGLMTPVIWSALLFFAVIWWLNLFNFMDGANGMAGCHAAVALLFYYLMLSGSASDTALLSFVAVALVFSLLVFLFFNLVLGRLFMGDAGSLSLAFAQALIGLTCFEQGVLTLPMLALIHASFVADASYTLIHRIKNKERLSQAHNKHLYQRLVKYGWTHGQSTASYAVVTALCCLMVYLIRGEAEWLHWLMMSFVYGLLAVIFIKSFRIGR